MYGTYLYIYNKKIFFELPACYQYGPVFKSLQFNYKNNSGILQNSTDNIKYDIDKNIIDVINKVIRTFGKYSSVSLSNWTKRSSGAWSKTNNKTKYWGEDIKEELIKQEFSNIITNYDNKIIYYFINVIKN